MDSSPYLHGPANAEDHSAQNLVSAYTSRDMPKNSVTRNQWGLRIVIYEGWPMLTVVRADDLKNCASCDKGSRLQFAFGRYLKWRRCRRHLTPNEKKVLHDALFVSDTLREGLTA